MKRRHLVVVFIACAASAVAAAAGPAAADPPPLGGSSGIVLDDSVTCSLTTIGYDGSGRLVGLTAGHCAGAGASVRVERALAAGPVGTVVFSDQGRGLDYAIIEFEPSKVTPVRSVGQTTIAGFGAPPGTGATVCSSGRSSGYDCGVVWGPMGDRIINQSCSVPGDSGGSVTVGDQLVGMNQGHYNPLGVDMQCVNAASPMHSPAYFRPIMEILQAVNATGGVGAGLRPV
ncbi:S1 family peptidase [Nocardia sp. NPDC059240]|uniref:S1 family peptidase n=1 Tax=Nocardia sp. NPDC059240 TaxID=3346786 RepID=UPI0036AF2E8E